MKFKKLTALLLLSVFALVGATSAQNVQNNAPDMVEMKDGKILQGTILSYHQGSTLRLQQANGEVIVLQDSDVAKIRQGVTTSNQPKQVPTVGERPIVVKRKTNGLYSGAMVSFLIGGDSENDDLSLGAGYSQTVGYKLNKWLGVGVGGSIDNYSRRGEIVYPVFGEIQLHLPSKKENSNLYFVGAGGYGFAFKRQSLDITAAEGGLMYHGGLGFRIATNEGLDVNVDMGYRFQKAHWERKLYNNDTESRTVNYNRIVFRIGLTLW